MILQTFLPLLSVLTAGLITVANAASLETHGPDFVPDAVLVVTEEEVKQSCVPTKNIIVVNGTSPGPELTFNVNDTVWIRVYNNIPDQNLTMASSPPTIIFHHSNELQFASIVTSLRQGRCFQGQLLKGSQY